MLQKTTFSSGSAWCILGLPASPSIRDIAGIRESFGDFILKMERKWPRPKGGTQERVLNQMQTSKDDALETTLMLGRTEGRRRKGQQRMRWLNGNAD